MSGRRRFFKVKKKEAPSGNDKLTELSKLVSSLTTCGKKEFDEQQMKALKRICKTSDDFVKYTYYLIMTQLDKEHAQIRYSCLLLINELFQRSHIFRTLLLNEFQNFLDLTAETDPEIPLPEPKTVAKEMKKKTLEFVQQWHKDFHEGYKQLTLAYNYLKHCKKVNFSDIDAQTVAERQRRETQEQHKENVLKKKIGSTLEEITEKTEEIKGALVQMENCFQLLMPSPDDPFNVIDFNDPQPSCSTLDTSLDEEEEEEDVLRTHGMGGHKFSLEIEVNPNIAVQENEDNKAVVDTLRELHHQVVSMYLPDCQRWLKILGKTKECTQQLKAILDLKQSLLNIQSKFKELKIKPLMKPSENDNDDSDEDDEFEDVPEKEGYEPVIPVHRRAEYGLEPLVREKKPVKTTKESIWNLNENAKEELADPTSRLAQIQKLCDKIRERYSESSVQKKESSVKAEDAKKDKPHLLSKAPKRPFDMDLYHWEEEKLTPPTIYKYDSLHSFWQSCAHEDSEVQLKDKETSLRERKIEFTGEFVPVKWSCRAPLPSGKLCPRKDRQKCPFHGPVVPRDENGNPINKDMAEKSLETPSTSGLGKTSEEDIPDWQDPELLQEIKAATGIDLEIKKKKKKEEKPPKNKKERKRRYPNLTDIKTVSNTSRRRLEKKVLNKSSVGRVARTLDTIDSKKFDDKFGNQWNYAFKS